MFYTKETKNLRPSKVGFGAHYTTNKQYKFSLKPSIYFNSNNLVVNMPMSFGYTLDKFWGIGNSSAETGTEEFFRQDINIQLEIQVPPLLFFSDRSGFIIDYKNTAIVDSKENQYILDESINGFDGGDIFGLGLNLIWDRRDNLFYPTSGHYQYIKFIVYPEPSDYVFSTFELDVRYYKTLLKNQVLATNLYIKSVGSNAPFYELPALGGQQRLRGYFEGRYRDRNYVAFQMELRQYFSKRFGFVAFGGFGDVGEELTDLNLKSLKYSAGGGLRYLFNTKENVNLRMDVAVGRDGNAGIYFGIEEAF
ncbi:BamA/TamA family outer membrane protein [Psychroserpens jangbogonensis]|uniref:BamA/TamA family outer membrane protein n=1 Tax=Psychroserpens jangbogonensis TaxID=1484460 RepID=UPI002409DF3B|nr:BamA/TamA family outer membrane protein [Psychroserpens jangbogonensis]